MQARAGNVLQRMEQTSDSRIEEQMDDLRDRMRLLQVDRKSNIHLLESNKQTNKAYIRQLKHENRDLRKAVAELKQSTAAASGSGGAFQYVAPGGSGFNDDSDELATALRHLNKVRKQHDDLRHRVQAQTMTLEDLKDAVKDLKLESKKGNVEDTPETRKIRVLETRLDKATMKFNEAQSIRKTYEQIVKRLKKERIGFDHQLATMERAFKAKQHDYDELLLLSADAAHAREAVLLELEKARNQVDEEKKHREREVREKRRVLKARRAMVIKAEKRGKHHKIERSDLSLDGETQLKASLVNTLTKQSLVGLKKQGNRSKIDTFESAFGKIKEATGVSDVNDVMQKLNSQEETRENLMTLSKENQMQVERLQADFTEKKTRIKELKSSWSGSGHRRKLVDELEATVAMACTQLERAKQRHERLAKVLIRVKAGVEHLVNLLESMRDDGQVLIVTDETIVERLEESELTLIHLLRQLKGSSVALSSNEGGNNSTGTNEFSHVVLKDLSVHNDLVVPRPYNQRIPLVDLVTVEETGGTGDLGVDESDEALSRDRIKRASCQLLMAQEKKKQELRHKVQDCSTDDSEDYKGHSTVRTTESRARRQGVKKK